MQKRENAPLSEGVASCDSCCSVEGATGRAVCGAVDKSKIPGNAKLGRPVANSNDARHSFKRCSGVLWTVIRQL